MRWDSLAMSSAYLTNSTPRPPSYGGHQVGSASKAAEPFPPGLSLTKCVPIRLTCHFPSLPDHIIVHFVNWLPASSLADVPLYPISNMISREAMFHFQSFLPMPDKNTDPSFGFCSSNVPRFCVSIQESTNYSKELPPQCAVDEICTCKQVVRACLRLTAHFYTQCSVTKHFLTKINTSY